VRQSAQGYPRESDVIPVFSYATQVTALQFLAQCVHLTGVPARLITLGDSLWSANIIEIY